MIPDFPQEKAKLMQSLIMNLTAKHRASLGVFGTFPAHVIHEGDRWKLIRTDGTEDTQTYTEVKGMVTISTDEIPSLTPDKVQKKMDELAEDMAQKTIKGMVEELNRVTEEDGQVVNAKGQEFTQEFYLQTFEKLDFEFDENENLIPPMVVLSPSFFEAKKDEIKAWETDETFQTKWNKLIEKKKGEWRDRENNRKLVD